MHCTSLYHLSTNKPAIGGTLVRMSMSRRFTYKSLIFLEINPKSTSYPHPSSLSLWAAIERRHGGRLACAGGGAGTGRDEERGHGRTPERAGLGASSRSSLSRGEQGRRRWEQPGRGTRARPDAGAGCARRWPRATARRPSRARY
jgi:hypothetical protein